jgi:hypothetical protein
LLFICLGPAQSRAFVHTRHRHASLLLPCCTVHCCAAVASLIARSRRQDDQHFAHLITRSGICYLARRDTSVRLLLREGSALDRPRHRLPDITVCSFYRRSALRLPLTRFCSEAPSCRLLCPCRWRSTYSSRRCQPARPRRPSPPPPSAPRCCHCCLPLRQTPWTAPLQRWPLTCRTITSSAAAVAAAAAVSGSRTTTDTTITRSSTAAASSPS